tara:strand:- start:72951 stop:74234 length:1284 start_codon:yes stop_codon:yes gene_type:complete
MDQDKDDNSFSLKALTPSLSSLWSPMSGGITSPLGFEASGIQAGLKASGKPDLALLLAPEGSICAGTFTQSSFRAACIDLSQKRLKDNCGKARAVLINSGQANACTGERGLIDSLRATEAIASRLGLKEEEVLICSTGIIGEPIPMNILLKNIDPLVHELSEFGGDKAAIAILTTDLIEKEIAFEAFLGERRVRIGGMAKGSGMIHPNMATMLGYLTCDAGVSEEIWNLMIQKVARKSFNAISVDGDTSTNDSFLAFCAGDLLDTDYLQILEIGLLKTAQYLAKSIARDGEGANCLIEIKVEGAEDSSSAIQIARTICSSSLVKTAIHGKDPNWGRIIAALGRSGIFFNIQDIYLWIGPYLLIQQGQPIDFDREKVSKYIDQRFNGAYLTDDIVNIRLIVGQAQGEGTAWGCDLSADYIRINADYTT